MKAIDMMTPNPACCTPKTPLNDVARMMVENHCGAIPVLNSLEMRIPVGMVTDRDITCRTVAKRLDSRSLIAADCMSSPVATVYPETTLEECLLNVMDADVRRIIVTSHKGVCIGIIALADIARYGSDRQLAELLREISKFEFEPSHVTAMM